MNRYEIDLHVRAMVSLARQLEGHLSDKEAALLALLPFFPIAGEVLEIGSFKGKSTIILAKSLEAAGGDGKVFACDPLTLACQTDPGEIAGERLPDIFHGNLARHGVAHRVEVRQMKSSELAGDWRQPLRVLWIDGDHTYAGAAQDVRLFRGFLTPGAIVCLHDVLHEHDGPIRAFMENILLDEAFGDCGLCGSIGWGQYVGGAGASPLQWRAKLSLYRKLSRLIPSILRWNFGLHVNRLVYKIVRSRVPHGPIDPTSWLDARLRQIERLRLPHARRQNNHRHAGPLQPALQ